MFGSDSMDDIDGESDYDDVLHDIIQYYNEKLDIVDDAPGAPQTLSKLPNEVRNDIVDSMVDEFDASRALQQQLMEHASQADSDSSRDSSFAKGSDGIQEAVAQPIINAVSDDEVNDHYGLDDQAQSSRDDQSDSDEQENVEEQKALDVSTMMDLEGWRAELTEVSRLLEEKSSNVTSKLQQVSNQERTLRETEAALQENFAKKLELISRKSKEELLQRLAPLEANLKNKQKEIHRLSENLNEMRKKYGNQQAECQSLQRDVEERESKCLLLSSKYKDVKGKNHLLQKKLETVTANLASAEARIMALEKLQNTENAKKLMQKRAERVAHRAKIQQQSDVALQTHLDRSVLQPHRSTLSANNTTTTVTNRSHNLEKDALRVHQLMALMMEMLLSRVEGSERLTFTGPQVEHAQQSLPGLATLLPMASTRDAPFQRLFLKFTWEVAQVADLEACHSSVHKLLGGVACRVEPMLSRPVFLSSQDAHVRVLSASVVLRLCREARDVTLIGSALSVLLQDVQEKVPMQEVLQLGVLPLIFKLLHSAHPHILSPASSLLLALSVDSPASAKFYRLLHCEEFMRGCYAALSTSQYGVHESISVVLERLSRKSFVSKSLFETGDLVGLLMEFAHGSKSESEFTLKNLQAVLDRVVHNATP